MVGDTGTHSRGSEISPASALDALDDEHADRAVSGLELESERLPYASEDRHAVTIARRRGGVSCPSGRASRGRRSALLAASPVWCAASSLSVHWVPTMAGVTTPQLGMGN